MQVPAWYDGDVSRETLGGLTAYAALVRKWSRQINLVSRKDHSHIETRHIWDSAQYWQVAKAREHWLDLGSGGGFPGLVVAILAKAQQPALQFTLVESDQRKATFLRTVRRELDLPVTILSERIEDLEPQKADVVSARALSNLDQLLGYAQPHVVADGQLLFAKGAHREKEILEAQENWRFDVTQHRSQTKTSAALLEIRNARRK